MIVVIATIDTKKGTLVQNPDLISRGFVFLKENRKLFEEIDVENKEQVEFLGTDTIRINPTNNLKSGTEYFVNMTRGTVADPVGNKFAGIAGTETYNFSTREVSSPTDPPVGIITGFVPVNPGIGYTSGDDAVVGDCRFELILTPAGSIIGLEARDCDHLFERVADVELNTTTGTGGRIRPVLAFKPNRTRDTGEGDNISLSLIIRVIDCI